jgi:hypothetical protein
MLRCDGFYSSTRNKISQMTFDNGSIASGCESRRLNVTSQRPKLAVENINHVKKKYNKVALK